MAAPVSVRLLPDPDQHDLLAATLERVNKASNLARTRALEQGVSGRGALRTVVKEELDRFKLPATFVAPALQRVEASLTRQKFGAYQSLVLPPAAVKWPASDRVTLPTAGGSAPSACTWTRRVEACGHRSRAGRRRWSTATASSSSSKPATDAP